MSNPERKSRKTVPFSQLFKNQFFNTGTKGGLTGTKWGLAGTWGLHFLTLRTLFACFFSFSVLIVVIWSNTVYMRSSSMTDLYRYQDNLYHHHLK